MPFGPLRYRLLTATVCIPTQHRLRKDLEDIHLDPYRTNLSNRSNSKGIKISGPVKDHDIGRNALRIEGHPPASLQTPPSLERGQWEAGV